MKIELKCINCENNFETDFKRRDKKFCNRKCYFEYANKFKIVGRKTDESLREIRTCIICKTDFEVKKNHEKKMCSDECRLIWSTKEENKTKRIEASQKSLLNKYGVISVFDTDKFKDNYKNNFIEKYGVEHPMYVPDFVDKLKNTFRLNHLELLLPKLKENNLELIGDYSVNKNGNTSLPYNFKCLTCDNIFSSTIMGSGKIPICRKCFPLIKNSKLEEIIKDFLNLNNISHLDNNRNILNGKEIDLLLEDYNLGIEVNGNYYHSEISGDKDKKYHYNKTELASSKNIKLIHILEDEIIFKKDIVLSRLSNLLNLNSEKIYARKTKIKEVSKKDSKEFLINNHIQGASIDKIRIGLYYENELVSLMTFGGLRKSMGTNQENGSFELLRFCNKLNTSVLGGFTKLLKNFITNYKPKKIISYADIRWSGLNELETVYYKNGFKFISKSSPNYWYLKIGDYVNRYHRFNFRKDILIKEGFDSNLTEFEIMKLKGYDRIWDCGNMKFEMNL